jgi:hypothetical protein
MAHKNNHQLGRTRSGKPERTGQHKKGKLTDSPQKTSQKSHKFNHRSLV